jgi:hypothetical protein
MKYQKELSLRVLITKVMVEVLDNLNNKFYRNTVKNDEIRKRKNSRKDGFPYQLFLSLFPSFSFKSSSSKF